jgi:hypothetical protein
MLKKLLSALFGRKKQEAERDKPKHPEATAIRREARRRNAMPAASRSTSSSPAARQDDAMTNPLHPLSPLNPINTPSSSCRTHDPAPSSHCDDSHRSSWGSSSCSSSDSGYSSSDSSSNCSSSD